MPRVLRTELIDRVEVVCEREAREGVAADGLRTSGTPPADPETLFEISTGAAVAAFLALSALAHFLVTTVWWRRYLAHQQH